MLQWYNLTVREEFMQENRAIKQPLDLADLVRDSRKAQSLTQEDLAGLSNTGTRFIIDLEKAKTTCEIGKVLQVLSALGVELFVSEE